MVREPPAIINARAMAAHFALSAHPGIIAACATEASFMCGIVGLLIKKGELRASLGEMVSPMLVCMGERGADSAGLAVFGEPLAPGLRRFSLYAPQAGCLWPGLQERL